MEQARVKQVAKKLDEIQAAALVYLDKYNALPGDDGDSHGGLIPPAASPNDGMIDNPTEFWQQIQASGILTLPAEGKLLTPWGTPYTVLYGAAGKANNMVCAQLPPSIAQQLDTRYDDGKGTTGGYRFAEDNNGTPATTSTEYSTVPNGKGWLCSSEIRKSLVGG